MSPVNFVQPSFAAGEISPNLWARVDLAKYHIAAKLLRNFFTWPSGGVSNRAGTMFIGRCKNSTWPVHLIPFQFNLIQTYVLEFGHLYMRVIMNGGYVLEPAFAIGAVTNANPGVLTVGGTNYSNGDQVFITGTGTQLDSTPGKQYLVANFNSGAGTFTLTDLDGNPINTTNYGAYSSGGTVARVYTLPTPYLGYILETAFPIDGFYQLNPLELTIPSPGVNGGWMVGDQIVISGTGTPLDSTTPYLVSGITSNNIVSLTTLSGASINAASWPSYGGYGGSAAKINLAAGSEVQQIKWTQSADTLTLCHPSHPPQDLTRTQHWIWNLTEIDFAPQVAAPSGVAFTNQVGTSGYTDTKWNYSYVVTAVSDTPPDESYPSAAVTGAGVLLNSDAGAYNTVTWKGLTEAQYYRVYKANPTYNIAINPATAMYGYIGTATGTSFVDTEIAPDFTQAPPQGTNPFQVGPITEVDVLTSSSDFSSDIQLQVTDISGSGAVLTPTLSGTSPNCTITGVTVTNGGQNYTAPVVTVANQGSGFVGHINVEPTWGLDVITATVDNGGSGYFGKVTIAPSSGAGCTFTPKITNGVIKSITVTGTPTSSYTNNASLAVTQSSGTSATFKATVTPGGNYPSCATYFQQRKVFAGSNLNPQTLWMTRPADFKNMDVSNPSQASDAIVATIASNQVNAIKWLVPMNNLVILSSGGAWLLVGGAITSPVAVTPSNTVVVPQNYVGAADLPPIVINYDILYVQVKGSIIRDLAYNFWVNVYTGTDMSVLAQHLFFGHNMERWAYAEQPFYQVWIVRDDGVLLSFTYLKEQDVYAWAHHDSPGSSGTDRFISVASIPEQQIPGINIDSVYFVVQRTIPGINGENPVKYVERMDGRNFLSPGVPASAGMTADVTKAWFVDCGLQYFGPPATTISGLDHLNGATVSILADGSVSPQQVVTNGSITLPQAASIVTVGLPYVSQLQTLCMQPEGMAMQVQDYRKKIAAVAVRVSDTRGLKVGPNFNDLTEIKMRSSAISMGTAIPLFTGDQRLVIDNQYLVDDDVCIQQDQPLPCTILGVIPEVVIGDGPG
jgi:hypothetical protein